MLVIIVLYKLISTFNMDINIHNIFASSLVSSISTLESRDPQYTRSPLEDSRLFGIYLL